MTKITHSPRSISFSTLSDHKMCGHYFKRKNVDRIPLDTNTIWTYYGTLVHKYVQATLSGELEAKVAAKLFIRTWFKFCKLYRNALKKGFKEGDYKLPKGTTEPSGLYNGPVRAIMNIKELFLETFGPYKVLYIEERLKENTEFPQYFGGYIDIVLELADGSFVVADFKTCSSHYMFNKYRNKYSDYQLALYKHFVCRKYNLDPKRVETYFITIAKDPKVKKTVDFVRVTTGPKKVENALKWMTGVLSATQRGLFVKNRTACHTFYGKSCPFFDTDHCK